MIKKIFLLLLFSFLGTSLLTFAQKTIPQNGWEEGKYYFKLDGPISNNNFSLNAEASLWLDGNIVKPLDFELMKAYPEDRYIKFQLDAEHNFMVQTIGRKFSELTVELSLSSDSIPGLNALISKTNIDSLILKHSKSKVFENIIAGYKSHYKNDNDILQIIKNILFDCNEDGKAISLKSTAFKRKIKKSCIVSANDTIAIGYKVKFPSTLEEWIDADFRKNMVELSIQNENPTLSYVNNLWQTYKHALDGFEQSDAPYTGRRAYLEFINKIRKETVPALIEKANKTLPPDCDPQIRSILENRLKIEFYSNNPMNLYAAERQQFLADAFAVFQDVEFNEDVLYDLPTACRIVRLIGQYAGVLPAERRSMPEFAIQMLQAKGYTYTPEQANLGYQIKDIPVQEWCDNVKELLRNYSINANDFLVYFMTILAYDDAAHRNWGLNKKQVDNIKQGYKSGDWQVPLKAIQLQMVYYENQLDLRIEE